MTASIDVITDDSLLAIHSDLNADISQARQEAELHRARADMAEHLVQTLESYRLRISQLPMARPDAGT